MTESKRNSVTARRVAAVSFPLLFAALTGRSGHGPARMGRIRKSIRSASRVRRCGRLPVEAGSRGRLES